MAATTPHMKDIELLEPLASRYVDVESLPWKPTPSEGIDMKVLLEDKETGLLTALFRWQPGAVIHQGNHGVTLPTGERGGLQVLRVHHFPVRSPAQYLRKARNGAAAYAAAPDVAGGDHWKSWGRMTDEQLEQAYAEHWYYNSPADVGRVRGDGLGLVRDPAPYRRWPSAD